MDWKWTITAVLPVASLILGAWLSQLSEGRREAAALAREEKVRQLDRDQARIERRETFELTHLVEVNDLLFELFDAALRCNTRAVDNQPLGEAGTQLQQLNRKMARTKGLVLDDALRGLVDTAHTKANRLSSDSSGDWQPQSGAWRHVEAAQTAVTKRIRDVYKAQADRL